MQIDVRRNGVFDTPITRADGAAIDLETIDDNVEFIRIYTQGGGDAANIGRITLSGTRTSTVGIDMLIGSGAVIDTDAGQPLTPVAQSWSGLGGDDSLTSLIRLSGAISDDLKPISPATSGSVRVGRIVRLQVGDEIQAEVRAVRDGAAIQQVAAKNIPAQAGQIIAEQGNIGAVDVVGPAATSGLHAGVVASNGSIDFITVSGAIAIDAPAKISAKTGILSIAAITSISATVIANDNGGDGDINYIEAFMGGINGSIRGQDGYALDNPHGIRSRSSLLAEIVFDGDLDISIESGGGDCSEGPYSVRRVVVHGDITPGGTITGACDVGEVVCLGNMIGGVQVISGTRIHSVEVSGDVVQPSSLQQALFVAPVVSSVVVEGSMSARVYSPLAPTGIALGTLRVGGDCDGYFDLASFDEIRIDGDLGPGTFGASTLLEVRGPLPPTKTVQIGRSYYGGLNFNGLQGQVVINASETTNAAWIGGIGVGVAGFEFAPLPHYANASSTYGGGAVGHVPYALQKNDCVPVQTTPDEWDHDATGDPDPLLNSQFSHWPNCTARDVEMTFYGRIASHATTEVRVWVWMYHGLWREVTDRCHIEIDAQHPRTIKIGGLGTQLMPPGYYAVVAPTTGNDRLYCLDTFAEAGDEPGVLDNATSLGGQPTVQFNFYLFQDCDNSNEIDGAYQFCGNPFCPADCDDGTATGTADGGVTIDDLLYYLDIFDLGVTAADLDDGTSTGTPDGGVTIDDLLYFLLHFENGC